MTVSDDLIQSAVELSHQFAERSDEIEKARRIPADISDQMARAGFFRLGAPRTLGGLEADPATSSQIFETLAQGDASCAWVAFIGTTSATLLSAIPETSAREVFATPETMITGVFATTGQAERVEGGFRVTGRWQWGSGSQNADWVVGGCLLTENGEPILDNNGRQKSHMMLMPASKVEFLDTWYVSGLRGTGSLDYQVNNLFVSEDRAVGYLREGRIEPGPLYTFPNFTFLALGIGAVSMGIARAAIDDLVALATSKKRVGGARKSVAEQQISQVKLAQAEATLRSARLLYYSELEKAWESAASGYRVSIEQRRDLRLATSHAVLSSVSVVNDMYELGGGSAVYETSRLQRHFRDINVARSHIMVSQSTLQTVGAHLFGLEPNTSAL